MLYRLYQMPLIASYLIGIDSECGSFCFQSIQPVTDLLEIEGKPNSPKSPNMSASSSDVLTDLYDFDESLSGVDSEYDTEEFFLILISNLQR